MSTNYKDLTFSQWIAMWNDLNVALFGEEEAKEYAKKDAPRNNALRKLWKAKGFKTVGEYEEWEKDHFKERDAYLRRLGVLPAEYTEEYGELCRELNALNKQWTTSPNSIIAKQIEEVKAKMEKFVKEYDPLKEREQGAQNK